jgi:hypothetical protein
MRLNFGRPFEDVEDAGIAQNPADLVFKRVAIAAMDLKRVIGI